MLNDDAIASEYEKNTGHAIIRTLRDTDDPQTPGILVANHGPFAWGPDALAAAQNAAILESIARMAYFTLAIDSTANPIGKGLHDKHFLRKHGANAYYGQKRD